MTAAAGPDLISRRPPRRRALVAIGIVLSAGVASSLRTQPAWASDPADSPMFHHDNLHTGVSADALGASAAPGLTVEWATLVGGGGHGSAPINASPAVVYNSTLDATLVYIASAGKPAAVDAINLDTGAIVWRVLLAGASVQSSPAVAGNSVYVGASDHILRAFDATTGQLQCSYDTGGRLIASPVVGDVDGSGPVVFIGDSGVSERNNAGHEWAINGVGNSAGDCTLKWRFGGWVNTGAGHSRTGSWSSPALATDGTGRPLVVMGSSDPDDAVYALDARDGSLVWHFQTEVTGKDQDVGAAPAIGAPGANGFINGVVYVDGKNRIEYAIDLLTGGEIWEFNMRRDSGININAQSATAIVGSLVVLSYANYVYALDAVTGLKVWRSPATSAPMLGSASVSGGPGDQVVFSGDLAGHEYAFSMADGTKLLDFVVGGTAKVVSTVAVSRGRVLFGATNGKLYALS